MINWYAYCLCFKHSWHWIQRINYVSNYMFLMNWLTHFSLNQKSVNASLDFWLRLGPKSFDLFNELSKIKRANWKAIISTINTVFVSSSILMVLQNFVVYVILYYACWEISIAFAVNEFSFLYALNDKHLVLYVKKKTNYGT